MHKLTKRAVHCNRIIIFLLSNSNSHLILEYMYEYEKESKIIQIRRLDTEQSLNAALVLVKRVFDEFVAPDYSEEGNANFFRFVTPEYLENLYARNGFVLGAAFNNESIVGMIAIRDFNHISLFFVDRQFQKKGIGRSLFSAAMQIIESQGMNDIHVHSSPFAVQFYESMGFTSLGPQCIEGGIRYMPMIRVTSDE
jgi:GNAT superfamily N-acetyltransferase